MKNIVIIGGGTGTSTLLAGLKKYPVNLSVIVSTADDGGSTGRLRKELGVMPPGDIRQCLVALSKASQKDKDWFNYRFPDGDLKGHTVGNLVIAGLEVETGSIEKAIKQAAEMLKVKGRTLPVTLKPTELSAKLSNGKIVVGEHNIDEPEQNSEFRILNLELKPQGPANPQALEAIKSADMIIFGPGDLYTSTLPNLLVKGMKEAINKSKAIKVLVGNIMTKFGQTDNFKASDFVVELHKYLHGKIDIAVINNQIPNPQQTKAYKKTKSELVVADPRKIEELGVLPIPAGLISQELVKKTAGDSLSRSIIRHNSQGLAKIIRQLL